MFYLLSWHVLGNLPCQNLFWMTQEINLKWKNMIPIMFWRSRRSICKFKKRPLQKISIENKIQCGQSFWQWELLPPKLYLVVFYQVSLVNQIRIACSYFRRPSFLLLGNFVVPYHMFIPPWGSCNKCSSMIVSVKDSVS